MLRRSVVLCVFLSCTSVVVSQISPAEVQLKLIDGISGLSWKYAEVWLTTFPGGGIVKARTNGDGVATVRVPSSGVVVSHSTQSYVACETEAGGAASVFEVRSIISAGATQAFKNPNDCGAAIPHAKAGQLVLMVRPWKPGENKASF